MINILFNDQQKTLEPDTTLASFVSEHAVEGNAFAVAINDTFVPRSDYNQRLLSEGDRIELLVPMQGG